MLRETLSVNDDLEITTDGDWPLAVMYFGLGNKEKAKAYATLFAASPELLLALESAVKVLKVSNIAGKSLYASDVTINAQNAIAKAKGGA